jgi:UDP-2-acetamido-3-amino-2,3-dideoxy-glucuronate N-acetyltransferase
MFITNNKKERKRIMNKSLIPNVFIHESSYIETKEISEGTKIWHFCHIMKNVKIGKNCSIGQNCVIGPNVTIGNGCKIQNNISIFEGVTLEDNVFVGPNVSFTNVINPRAFISRKDQFMSTLIKEGASLGSNSTIVCGNIIGKYSFVGAGCLINRDIVDYEMVVGNPQRHLDWICECGIRLKKFSCISCGKTYKRVNGGVEEV